MHNRHPESQLLIIHSIPFTNMKVIFLSIAVLVVVSFAAARRPKFQRLVNDRDLAMASKESIGEQQLCSDYGPSMSLPGFHLVCLEGPIGRGGGGGLYAKMPIFEYRSEKRKARILDCNSQSFWGS